MNLYKSMIATFVIAGFVACGGESKDQAAPVKLEDPADLSTASEVYTLESGEVVWTGSKLYETSSHSGTVAVKSAKLGLNDGAPVAGSFAIDMTTIKNTDLEDPELNAKLVGHLKNDDFFAVDKYPTANFEIVSVSGSGDSYTVTGNLTIKDTTLPVTAPATFAVDGDTVTGTADFTLDRTEFGVRYGSEKVFTDLAQDKVIDDKINLKVDLKLKKG